MSGRSEALKAETTAMAGLQRVMATLEEKTGDAKAVERVATWFADNYVPLEVIMSGARAAQSVPAHLADRREAIG